MLLKSNEYTVGFFFLFFFFWIWQELERRLALQEQDMAIVKTVKSEAARVPDMEKELKCLRDYNAFLRSNSFLSVMCRYVTDDTATLAPICSG